MLSYVVFLFAIQSKKVLLSFSGSESGDNIDIDHFDFNIVTQALPFLRELRITYGYDCSNIHSVHIHSRNWK